MHLVNQFFYLFKRNTFRNQPPGKSLDEVENGRKTLTE